jgi:hypothetical protein
MFRNHQCSRNVAIDAAALQATSDNGSRNFYNLTICPSISIFDFGRHTCWTQANPHFDGLPDIVAGRHNYNMYLDI